METVIALMILAIIGGALMALNVQIQSVANSSRYKTAAEGYAEKMVEQVRGKKNIGGGTTSLAVGNYSDGNLTPLPSGVCATSNVAIPKISGTEFKQCVAISACGSGKKVSALVFWQEKSKINQTKVETCLYDF